MSSPAVQRVVQAAAFYKPHAGGQETFVQGLSRALAKRRLSVHVFTTNTEGAAPEELDQGVRIRRFPVGFSYYKALWSWPLIRALRLARQEADVVHLHAPYPFGLEGAALGSRRAAVLVTFHGEGMLHTNLRYTLPRNAYARWEKTLFLATDRVVFLSETYRASLRLPPGLLEKTEVIPTATDVELFHPGIRARDGSVKRVLFVGNLKATNRYKGLDILVQALAKIPVRERPGLVVVARGELVAEYRALARSLRVQAEFRETVTDEELPEIYRSADLFVLPSIHGPENAPLVVVESMASGTPVVASGLPGVDELVRDGESGLLVPPRDADALSAAILRFVRDPALVLRMSSAARKQVEEHHSWAAAAAAYQDLYRRLAATRER